MSLDTHNRTKLKTFYAILTHNFRENKGVVSKKTIESITSTDAYMELSLAHHGEFGFDANVTGTSMNKALTMYNESNLRSFFV